MKLYRGIAAGLLAAVILSAMAFAMPLPETPPEVDSTPVSHEEEPEGFRDAEGLPQEIPVPEPQTDEPPPEPTGKPAKQSDVPAPSAGLDTGSILLIGAAIWYAVVLVGLSGGRRGIGRRSRRQD